MALQIKYNLPDTYTEEYKEYRRLYELGGGRSISGSISFTSSSSNIAYNSTTGQLGIMQQLQTTLATYLISAADYNNISNEFATENAFNQHLADNASHVPHLGTTTNAGNVYSVTSTEVVGVEDKFSVKFNAVATDTATLNISSDGTARTLKKPDGSDFKPKAGIYSFIRDGVNFQLLGEGGEYGTALNSDVRSTKTVGTESGVVQGTLNLTNLTAGNLKKDIVIDGVTGILVDYSNLVAGNAVIQTSTTQYSTSALGNNGVYYLANAIQLTTGYGSIRVKLDVISGNSSSAFYVAFYKNGVKISGDISCANYLSWTTISYDMSGVNVNDTIQAYVKATGYSNAVKNLSLGIATLNAVGTIIQ